MSTLGKILFGIAGLSALVVAVVRTVFGGWVDWLYVPFFAVFIGMIASLIVDIKFYKEFLTMRTTKHGMNMLSLIGLTIVLLVAINFMAIRNNKKWDLTNEGLNSISDQTKKVLAKIDDKATVRFFYREGTEGVNQVRAQFKEVIELYSDENPNVQIEFVNSIRRPGLAKEYGVDRAAAMVFIDYKGKRNRVDPLSEEGLTTAIVKATRDKNKRVAILTGHGEMSISETGPDGAAELKSALEDGGYDVEELSLVDKGAVPEEIDLVMILGPKTSLLDPELQALRDYTKAGGDLFIAADPGERHNLALLTKPYGIQFNNDYVLDQFGQILGASAAMALGREYGSNDITKDFNPGMMTLFHLASSLEKASDTEGLTVEDVVKTGDTRFATNEIAQGQVEVSTDNRGPHTVAMTSKGKGEKDGSEFSVVVIGDSDFLSNQLFYQHLNRDLAMNSVAYQLKESNLISIRPRQPKGTTLTLTEMTSMIYLWAVILPMPIFMFGLGGFSWYRRRNA
jgi:ABC-type uncharacterized transport system involved in gliding motility auxiliary subunit